MPGTLSEQSITFIQVHIEMDGNLTLFNAHNVADEVEAALREAFPGAEVMIHQDPHGLDEEGPPI